MLSAAVPPHAFEVPRFLETPEPGCLQIQDLPFLLSRPIEEPRFLQSPRLPIQEPSFLESGNPGSTSPLQTPFFNLSQRDVKFILLTYTNKSASLRQMLMSALVTKAVWTRSQHRGAALLLLLALASYANRQGLAWPKLATLARRARMSRRYVTSLLRLLAETGEIEIDLLPSDRRRRRYRLVAFVRDAADSRSSSRPPKAPPQPSTIPDDPILAEWQAIAHRTPPEPFRLGERLELLAAQLPAELLQRSRWKAELLRLDGELEHVEAELARIEQALLRQLASQLSGSQLAQLEAQVAAELQPLQHRLSDQEHQRQQRRQLHEQLRQRFHLPRLSLLTVELPDPGSER